MGSELTRPGAARLSLWLAAVAVAGCGSTSLVAPPPPAAMDGGGVDGLAEDALAPAADAVAPAPPVPDASPVGAPDAPDAALPDSATPDLTPDVAPDLPPFLAGEVCASDGQCASGYCVDQRCCSVRACAGDCNFCRGPGGTCTVLTRAGEGGALGGCITRYACDERRSCRKLTRESCRDFNDCLGEKCIAGVCEDAGYLHVWPEMAEMGTVPPGSDQEIRFTVRNRSGVPADPFDIVLVPVDGATELGLVPDVDCGPLGLEPNYFCQFTVRLAVKFPGPKAAVIELRRGATILWKASVGSAGPAPALAPAVRGTFAEVSTSAGLDRGTVDFEIDNPAGGSDVVSFTLEGRDPDSFAILESVAQPPCTLPVAPGTRCRLGVALRPAATRAEEGPKTARLVITSARGRAIAGLYGTRILP